MGDYGHDSETSATEAKPRPRRQRRKRPPTNSHDYKDTNIDATHTISNPIALANQAELSRSRTSLEYSGRDAPGTNPSMVNKSDKRRNHANRRLTKMSNTSEEVDNMERHKPRRKHRQAAHRVARSVSEEVLALDERTVETSIKETEKKISIQSENLDRHNDRRRKSRPSEHREPRKKRRSKPNISTSDNEENYQGDEEYSEIFPIDKEDVIHHPPDVIQVSSKTTASRTQMVPLPSQKSDLVYIEKKGGQGFVNEHKSRISATTTDRTRSAPPFDFRDRGGESTLEFVLKLQLGFRNFSFIVQGVLSGLALSQCIFVFSLASESDKALLHNYYKLALTYQSIYYFLLAICCVSIFDRYVNLSSGWSQFCSVLIRKPSRAIALISYVFALIFSVSLAQLDDRISWYRELPDLWVKNASKHIATWKAVNVLRVVGSVLGWITVALAPNDDETTLIIEEKINKEKCDGISIANGRCSTSMVTIDKLNS